MTKVNSFSEGLNLISARKGAFLGVFLVVFALSFSALYAVDFYPELVWPEKTTDRPEITLRDRQSERDTGPRDVPAVILEEPEIKRDQEDRPDTTETTTDTEADSATVPPEVALGLNDSDADPYPVEITIESLGKTIDVLNPTSRSVADLDAALLEGVVRHPDSATFTNEGNIFLLGHSSYLPNVLNRNYQAFNGIQHLNWGDVITVRSTDTEYTYRVDKVYEAKAGELTVPIAGTGPRLTLATCDSFGSKDDRYIVEATLVAQKRL